MEYIKETLGLNCTRKKWAEQTKLPYFLLNEYNFEAVTIGSQDCIFLKPKNKLANISTIKKHLNRLSELSACYIVFELSGITRQRKASFIEAKIPFAVPGKQLYLPFIGAVLSERNDADVSSTDVEKLMPSAQMLLFAFLINKNEPIYLSEAAKRFGITAMSISRAAGQLVQAHLVERKNQGVQKFIITETTPAELFSLAKPRLVNPVRKEVFISRSELNLNLFPAGLSALSDASMLNPPSLPVYGTTANEKSFVSATTELLDSETFAALQIWRYDPRLISQNGKIDALSLYISMAESTDERIEKALEELLQEVF